MAHNHIIEVNCKTVITNNLNQSIIELKSYNNEISNQEIAKIEAAIEIINRWGD